MKTPRPNALRPVDQNGREQGVRPAIQIAAWLVCLACLGLVIIVHFARVRANQRGAGGQSELAGTPQPATSQRAAVAPSTAPRQSESVNETLPGRQTRVGGVVVYTDPTPATRQWVSSLV